MTAHELDLLTPDDIVLDALPDDVVASIDERTRWIAQAVPGDMFESLVEDAAAWPPGSVVSVAFLGGTSALHADIAGVCAQIESVCNVRFDFGRDAAGAFRTWSPADTAHAADIRVSFDLPGYFSLVGRDSVDPVVGGAGGPVGGGPGQRSLNLGGYASKRPVAWKGTVLHEFLHALAFHHEHQNPKGTCQLDFRWEDDPGYEPTTDQRGAFVNDAAGRRPGIYTYLSGFPNGWSREKTDHNLRPVTVPVTASAFDAASVMLYRFPALFYRTADSPCAPSGDGQQLSAGDIAGLQRLYPHDDAARAALRARTEQLLATLPPGDDAMETLRGARSIRARVAEALAARLGAM